jgi:quercetin dioxygenase-like cupin family protein
MHARLAATAVIALTASTMWAVPAGATPPRDVEAKVLWQVTDGPTDYILRQITIAPGGSTGWHSHPGELFGTVKEGVLMHNRADCSLDGLYVTGQQIVEKGGPGYVHIGRNVGPGPLVLEVLYVTPTGVPLAQDAPDPGCGFA